MAVIFAFDYRLVTDDVNVDPDPHRCNNNINSKNLMSFGKQLFRSKSNNLLKDFLHQKSKEFFHLRPPFSREKKIDEKVRKVQKKSDFFKTRGNLDEMPSKMLFVGGLGLLEQKNSARN